MRPRKLWFGLLVALLIGHAPLTASAAVSVTCTYDSQGRVHTAVYVNGATTRTVTYTYDAAGSRSTVVSQ